MDVDVQDTNVVGETASEKMIIDKAEETPKKYVPVQMIPFEEMISQPMVLNDASGREVHEFREASHMELKHTTRAMSVKQIEECIDYSERNGLFQEAYGNVMTLPKEGSVYPFYVGNTRKHEKDFAKPLLTDGHSWKLRRTGLLHPGSNIQMMQWDVVNKDENGKQKSSPDFKRAFYYDLTTNKAFVHYYGDSKASIQSTHGNAKQSSQIHYSNAKIIQEEIKKQTKVMPTALYNAMSSNVAPGLVGVFSQPRNVRAVRYQQQKSKEEITLNEGTVADAMHISNYTGDKFVRYLVAAPEVSAIVMTKTGQDLFNDACKKATPDTTVVTGYDTTFNYGNTYISMMGYNHPQLERVSPEKGTINPSPFIPVSAMVHQKRAKLDHKVFWDVMRDNLDTDGKNCVMVSDQEFTDHESLKGAKNVACWNHLKNNVKHKVDGMGIKRKEEQGRIKGDMDRLLHSTTMVSYEDRKNDYFTLKADVHPVWNHDEFQKYYDRNIDKIVKEKAGRWVLDDLGLDSRRGMTSNSLESLNSKFKHNQPGGDKTLPETMLEIREFIAHEERNVQQAFYGRGPYQLKPEYRHLLKDPREMPSFQIETPEEAARQINMALGKAGEKIDVAGEKKEDQKNPTLQGAAKWLFDNQRFELAPKSGTWLVGNYNDDFEKEQRMVKLKPPSCTCGASVMCPHMLCVLKANGMRPDFEIYPKEIKMLDKSDSKPFRSGKKLSQQKTR